MDKVLRSGKERRGYRRLCTLILVLATCACGGIGLAYEHDLVGPYAVWATDQIEQTAVVEKIPDSSSGMVVVGPMVVAYGWNDTAIIAQQHPNLDGFDEIDKETTHWFIVEVATGELHGPLTEAEFVAQMQTLNLPETLTFTHTLTP